MLKTKSTAEQYYFILGFLKEFFLKLTLQVWELPKFSTDSLLSLDVNEKSEFLYLSRPFYTATLS